MRKNIFILISLLTFLFINSCTLQDDIDKMFVGRTWYMIGGRLNGTDLNSEVKGFYVNGSEGYKIAFQATTFTGELKKGIAFSGTWNVNSNTRAISLRIKEEPSTSELFDRNVYTVLKEVKYYEGDASYIILYADKENFIRLNHER